MDRKETTKFLGQLLINTRFGGAGKHWASEVSIDPWGREAKRVDYMQFSPADQCSISGIEKGIFTCYEVKSCKEDVYSGNGLNFLGEKNYIVTTMECYKDILPDLRSGKFAKHMREQFPESSNYFGVMVAIPDWAEATDEFEKPTPLDAEVRQWKLAVWPERSQKTTQIPERVSDKEQKHDFRNFFTGIDDCIYFHGAVY